MYNMLCDLNTSCAIWMWNVRFECELCYSNVSCAIWICEMCNLYPSCANNLAFHAHQLCTSCWHEHSATVKHNFRLDPLYTLGDYILPCTRRRHYYFFISTFHSAHQLRSRPVVPFNCSQCLILASHVRPQYQALFDSPIASYWQIWSVLPPHMFHRCIIPPPPSCPPASILTGHASSISDRVLGRK